MVSILLRARLDHEVSLAFLKGEPSKSNLKEEPTIVYNTRNVATSAWWGESSALKLKAVARRNGNMAAKDSTSSHLRPLLSMKKYAIADDLATSALMLVEGREKVMNGDADTGTSASTQLTRNLQSQIQDISVNSPD